MQLSECRNRIIAAARKMGKSYGPEEIDMALQMALNRVDLSAYFALTITTPISFTANAPELSVAAITGFRPEKVWRAQLAYNDRGVWATGTSYAVNDLVTGDGDPDAYYYVCTTAHTSSASNEPGVGDSTDWERVLWKRGDKIEIIDIAALAKLLGDGPWWRNYLPDDFIFATVGNPLDAGKPRFGSFLTEDIFVVYPPPQYAYKVEFVIRAPVTDWNPGTEANVEIDVPLNVLLPILFYGAVYFLDTTAKDAETKLKMFEEHIRMIDGNTAPQGAGIGLKDESAYRDCTDWPGGRGFWPFGTY